MTGEPVSKEQKLVAILGGLKGCVIAFSGGLDSTYLAVMAKRHARGRVLCVTLIDQATPSRDAENARDAARRYGLEHLVVEGDIPADVRANSPERCYICKRRLFTLLDTIRERNALETVLDGENASDADDDRPGARAARELGIRSPLAEAGLTKPEIMELAWNARIAEWDRVPSACLSTRITSGTHIDDATLRKVDLTEEFIRSKGIRMIRARAEGPAVRLELGQAENTPENRALLAALEAEIAAFGWRSVQIDPSGYVPAGKRRRK